MDKKKKDEQTKRERDKAVKLAKKAKATIQMKKRQQVKMEFLC